MAAPGSETATSAAGIFRSRYVIVGGGIAGVSCAEQLALQCPEEEITIVTASPVVKATSNVEKICRVIESFDVVEKPSSYLTEQYPNIRVLEDVLHVVDTLKHELTLQSGKILKYEYLCLCIGARPQLLSTDNPFVLGIRDTETVKVLQERLRKSRRIVVVGNGGIAIELVYELQQCEVVWVLRHSSMGATFFDPGAAHFFLEHQKHGQAPPTKPLVMRKRTMYHVAGCPESSQDVLGSALGPDWASGCSIKGSSEKKVHIEYNCEVKELLSGASVRPRETLEPDGFAKKDDWPVYVVLTNGHTFGCDLVVSATGVRPNTDTVKIIGEQLNLSEDGGIAVDSCMRSSTESVYAAGDVCTASWPPASLWFQMRLWTQARQMGHRAATCMAAALRQQPEPVLDSCFDIFAHVTRFFGFKVVLLGLFNGQGLGNSCEALLRVTPSREYVKALMQNGRLIGAVLVGETDLEETFENLMFGQLDLSAFGEHLLDPDIDLEDYFD
ncbi:pyridine nucleotide-disulfide oxidoreductase domain-containing protein 1-like [Ornithodoros turicata]|uniref:pyridine nucleotide-disulfide oxidoreductase domain-containing protein 1-like n=1 Tax=Ornithodoros turicata TaxID=34597 RepID=UPI003138615F